ncbi:MAG TPA: MASE1 domain-containing protein [Candidatus Eisenbacteria bacterium]|nr:MASE1 domain-containing protein [Candidatus Eisenbacteria bacterium]
MHPGDSRAEGILPPLATRARAVRSLAGLALLTTVYFAAAKGGLALAVVHPSASAVWPPAGIALAAFLLYGRRVWPAIALGAFLANATTAGSWATSAGIAVGNTLEGLVGAWLISRFAEGRAALGSTAGVFKFVAFGAGLGTLLSATIGVGSLALGGYLPAGEIHEVWTTWWLGDAVGILVVAPVLLLWVDSARPQWPRHRLEAAGAALLFVATGVAFFGGIGVKNAPIGWFWIPVIVWVAYRFGQRSAATMILALATVSVWGTIRGMGPFVLPSANASLLLLQAFLGVVAVSAMTLSAVVAARERTLSDLRRARDELEERVRRRTAALARANQSLQAEIDERLRLQRDLVTAGESERLRLGRDLHDDLGQLLTGISFLASAAERKLSAQARVESDDVREIRHLVQEAISKTRLLSLGLTPVSLGTGGLRTAVQELAAMTERVFGVACALSYDESIVVDRALAATNLYRIVQEAISNAVRHAGGTRIDISLTLADEMLTLVIRDDGTGLANGGSEREGLGLNIMKYRAEVLGGTLEVESDGEGTTVRCVVPGLARVEAAPPPIPE